MNKKLLVMEQIRMLCKIYDLPREYPFIEFVYNKKLKSFSCEKIKKLREEYENRGEKNV